MEIVTLDDVRSAHSRLADVIHRTPVMTSRHLDEVVRARLFFKCENFQRIGAFKLRGAFNALSRLDQRQLDDGVISFSSGNHAQAVALAAQIVGTKATIGMPADAPPEKLAATKGYGAEIVPYDRYTQDRLALARTLAAERHLTIIPPYDDVNVIAGQGTVALELLEEVPDLDMLVVPIGGGGLIAGCATVAKALRPGLRVIGVEPETADDTKRSLLAGTRVSVPVSRTIADGLAASIPGELTFSINRHLVDDVVLVPDDEIRHAMVTAFERLKIVLEPSGAVGLAALLAGRAPMPADRIGVVLTGGNISAARFAHIVGALS
ncbi:MAG TPA: threonine/serine dehydratase [Actinopolymorphaceae bacterium]|jgi:threonine dehydratase